MKAALKVVGSILIVMGIIGFVIVLKRGEQLNIFSLGEISRNTLMVGVVVFFYHLSAGLLCWGVADVLESVEAKKESSSPFKFCPYCHKEIEKDATFCPDCGQEIKDTADKNVKE